jgi:hypothetical protein
MIMYNAIQTPDGTVLESRDRWDFNSYIDANGNVYAVDGGLDYLKRSFKVNDYKELSLDDTAPHKVLRQAVTWGTRGTEGTEELQYVKVADLSDDHIKAILNTQHRAYPQIIQLLRNELIYRGIPWTLEDEV